MPVEMTWSKQISVFSVALLVDGHPSVDGVRVLCQKGAPIERARLLFPSVVGCIVGVASQTQNIQHGIVAERLALFTENASKEREYSFRLRISNGKCDAKLHSVLNILHF